MNEIHNIVCILIKNVKEHIKVNNDSFMQQEEQEVIFFHCIWWNSKILFPHQIITLFSCSCVFNNIYQVFPKKCSHVIYCLADNYCILSYSMLNYVFSSILSSEVFCHILDFWWKTESKLLRELHYFVKFNSIACF